jgi:hypothetical protein
MSQSVTQCWTMAELPGIDLTEGVDLGKGSVRPQVCNYNQVHVQTSLHIRYPKTMRTQLGKTWESRRHGAKSPGVIACLATCSFVVASVCSLSAFTNVIGLWNPTIPGHS